LGGKFKKKKKKFARVDGKNESQHGPFLAIFSRFSGFCKFYSKKTVFDRLKSIFNIFSIKRLKKMIYHLFQAHFDKMKALVLLFKLLLFRLISA